MNAICCWALSVETFISPTNWKSGPIFFSFSKNGQRWSYLKLAQPWEIRAPLLKDGSGSNSAIKDSAVIRRLGHILCHCWKRFGGTEENDRCLGGGQRRKMSGLEMILTSVLGCVTMKQWWGFEKFSGFQVFPWSSPAFVFFSVSKHSFVFGGGITFSLQKIMKKDIVSESSWISLPTSCSYNVTK